VDLTALSQDWHSGSDSVGSSLNST
jgi:hypothetical protein